MAYSPIITVNITIKDVQVSSEGFGTPIFITSHRKHENRVESYTSASAVLEVYGADSYAYTAAQAVFSQQPSVTVMKIGRRESIVNLQGVNVVSTEVQAFTITTDAGDFTVTDSTATTPEGLAVEVKDQIEADAATNALVAVTITGGVVSLAGIDGAFFTVAGFTIGKWAGYEDNDWVGSEGAAATLVTLEEEDNDFYFVTSDDNSYQFVMDMAAAVESADASRMYFYSDSNAVAVSAVTTGLAADISQLNYLATVALFHETADDSAQSTRDVNRKFPECAWVGANAPYDAGSVNWSNVRLAGVGPSLNAKGNRLTTGQKQYLAGNNYNYVEYDAGNSFVRNGTTVGNEWIDTVRGVHWQESDLTVSTKALMLGQKGGKVDFDDGGMTRVREVISTSLQRGVNRNFLSSYEIFIPANVDITGATRNTRILSGVTFTAVLKGAINEIVIQGSVSSTL
jgi:hypothetical protein